MSLQRLLNGAVEAPDDGAQVLQERIGPLLGAPLPDRFASIRAAIHQACVERIGPEHETLEASPEALLERVREVAESSWPAPTCGSPATSGWPSTSRWSTTCSATGPSSLSERPHGDRDHGQRPRPVYVERGGKIEETRARFAGEST